jgi:dipeptidyl-peptidase 4
VLKFQSLIIITSSLLFSLLSSPVINAKSNGQQLTVERIYRSPALTGSAPIKVKLSPKGERVTFLKGKAEDQNRYDLWEYHIKSGKTQLLVDSAKLVDGDVELSAEEKARRERQRLFAKGIAEYQFSPDGKGLLFPLNGDLYFYDIASANTKQLTNTKAFETDPKVSPKGNFVSFIREQNLYVVELASGKETALTTDGGGVIKNGMAEFVAQEEMSRYTGYWWAPDESKIAYTQVDESPVAIEQRYEINADSFKVYDQRYPSTGTNNVAIKLAVVGIKDGKRTWLDIGEEKDIYIPRVKWLPNAQQVSFQWQNRAQNELRLYFADAATGASKLILTERSKTWINLHKQLKFLKSKPQFIWASERDGYRHLYLYNNDGQLIKQLTQGKFIITSIDGISQDEQTLYVTSTKKSNIELHLYALNLATNKFVRITQHDGEHKVVLAKNASVYIDNFSSPEVPPQVSLHDISGKRLTWIEQNQLDKNHPYYPYYQGEPKAEFGQIKAADGQMMNYRLYKPTNMQAGKKYPVIVDVYGGPGAQRVVKRWAARNGYWHKYMASRGYVVFSLDNRGSKNQGKAFEDPIHLKLGDVELQDQLTGVEFLKQHDFVDDKRIGIFGWSYGGYMTIMALFKEPEIFAAGVSVAPVTDWYLYDTHYTERYLGHPKTNAKGYEQSNVFPYVDGYKNNLMIIHGMADDNVLFTNATKLYKVMQDKELPFEMINYPGAKHSIWGEHTRIQLFNAITEYFDRKLKKD